MYITAMCIKSMMVTSQPLFGQVDILMAYPSLKPYILFYSNGLAIWHSFPNITHIKVNNGIKSVILNLIDFEIFRAYPSLKPFSFKVMI